ncbi:major facilitator superfamily domain-containing protein [Mariannaea sp. PMI_226]|nr:major facilitator superfamily domain-containing protein [Mariannaea sp. PMI_226]
MGLSNWLQRQNRPPVLLKLRSSSGLIVMTCSFACFTDTFLYGVIVPVMPFSLQSRTGLDQDRVQYWISLSLAMYGVSLLVFSPVWGYIADRYQNRKIPMLVGLVALLASTAILCLSRNIATLMVGRALQGISAGLTWTVGLALAMDSVDEKDAGKACGWVGVGASIGILLAPLLGGVVFAHGGYYAVFALCFGLLGVDIFLRLAIIEVKAAKRWLTDTTTMPPSDIESKPATPEILTDDDISKSMPSLESSKMPTQPSVTPWGTIINLLRKPRFIAALCGTIVHSTLMTSFDSTLPLLTKDTFGWDSIGGGLIFLPLIMPSFLSPLVGAVCDKYGPKWPATFGFFFATPFLACLRFVTKDTIAHKVLLCCLLTCIGVAIACIFSPLMAEVNWAIETNKEESGIVPVAQAYGLYNVAYSGGSMIGPIMAGLIRDEAGWGTVGWSLAILTFVSAFPQMIWTGGNLKVKFMKESESSA